MSLLERTSFEREVGFLLRSAQNETREQETEEGLAKKTSSVVLLPHRTEKLGKDIDLSSAVPNPGFYDGASGYRIAGNLQKCLDGAMKAPDYKGIKVAIADLTGAKLNAPDFAGRQHKDQVFVASVAKIALLLTAFQLRHDVRREAVAAKLSDVGALFDRVRDNWALRTIDPKGKAVPFVGRLRKRGGILLAGASKIGFSAVTKKGERIPAGAPKMPKLKEILVSKFKGLSVDFAASGESRDELSRIVHGFNVDREADAVEDAQKRLSSAMASFRKARSPADKATTTAALKKARADLTSAKEAKSKAEKKQPEFANALKALEFRERLGIAIGGLVPGSNFAVATVVADLGFDYIASTLLQTGLYNPDRGGGLWLGADYQNLIWSGGSGICGTPQSATAASLVSFLTLLAQGALISREASSDMKSFMQKLSPDFPGTGSWFKSALGSRNPKLVLSKVGYAKGVQAANVPIADEIAYVEYDDQVENDDGSKRPITVRFAVAALRAKKVSHLEGLIREIDDCIRLNNGLSASRGMRLP